MDTPKPQRRLWPFVVTAVATAAIAFATAGAAASDDEQWPRGPLLEESRPGGDSPGSRSSGKDGDPRVTPVVLPG
jgi:hypothetical protein